MTFIDNLNRWFRQPAASLLNLPTDEEMLGWLTEWEAMKINPDVNMITIRDDIFKKLYDHQILRNSLQYLTRREFRDIHKKNCIYFGTNIAESLSLCHGKGPGYDNCQIKCDCTAVVATLRKNTVFDKFQHSVDHVTLAYCYMMKGYTNKQILAKLNDFWKIQINVQTIKNFKAFMNFFMVCRCKQSHRNFIKGDDYEILIVSHRLNMGNRFRIIYLYQISTHSCIFKVEMEELQNKEPIENSVGDFIHFMKDKILSVTAFCPGIRIETVLDTSVVHVASSEKNLIVNSEYHVPFLKALAEDDSLSQNAKSVLAEIVMIHYLRKFAFSEIFNPDLAKPIVQKSK
jgi:hypothetical protein